MEKMWTSVQRTILPEFGYWFLSQNEKREVKTVIML